MVAKIITKKEENTGNQNSDKEINRIYTYEEYCELEEIASFKSEFVNGKIIPISGGSINHSRIKSMFFGLLFIALQNRKDTELLDSDLKIHIPTFNRSVYPDACVIIGEPELYQNNEHAITNPTLIIEVGSKSTERYDRKGKFRMYQIACF